MIFSPCDLTCGWDGHEHPRGTRVVIDQARQVGANLVTYVLGTFQLGRFLSTTKVYYEAAAPSRDDFVFAQLDARGRLGPRSVGRPQPAEARPRQLDAGSEVQAARTCELKDPKTATYPLLYMTGHREFALERRKRSAGLQRYLKAGGLLLADACCGRMAFDVAFRREIAKVLPGSKLERLPADHPLYHCHYDIKQVDYTPRVREDFGPFDTPGAGRHHDRRPAGGDLQQVRPGQRLGAVPHAYSYGLKDESALQIGTNVIVYAMTH